MNLCRPTEVRARLRELGVRPSRALGQNFLIDRHILDLLIDAAELSERDTVLEIGPGLGTVTEGLLARAGGVLAVEKDARLYEFLRRRFAGCERLQLRHADALDLDYNVRPGGPDKLVSNLPYAVGSRVLAECFLAAAPPALLLVTVQDEVAHRLAAPPGDAARGLLSVWAQWRYEVRPVKRVSPTCFWPAPEVGSTIVRLRRRADPAPCEAARAAFRDVTRLAFGYRRKQLANALARAPAAALSGGPSPEAWLRGLGLDPRARPEDLAVADWERLAQALAAAAGG